MSTAGSIGQSRAPAPAANGRTVPTNGKPDGFGDILRKIATLDAGPANRGPDLAADPVPNSIDIKSAGHSPDIHPLKATGSGNVPANDGSKSDPDEKKSPVASTVIDSPSVAMIAASNSGMPCVAATPSAPSKPGLPADATLVPTARADAAAAAVLPENSASVGQIGSFGSNHLPQSSIHPGAPPADVPSARGKAGEKPHALPVVTDPDKPVEESRPTGLQTRPGASVIDDDSAKPEAEILSADRDTSADSPRAVPEILTPALPASVRDTTQSATGDDAEAPKQPGASANEATPVATSDRLHAAERTAISGEQAPSAFDRPPALLPAKPLGDAGGASIPKPTIQTPPAVPTEPPAEPAPKAATPAAPAADPAPAFRAALTMAAANYTVPSGRDRADPPAATHSDPATARPPRVTVLPMKPAPTPPVLISTALDGMTKSNVGTTETQDPATASPASAKREAQAEARPASSRSAEPIAAPVRNAAMDTPAAQMQMATAAIVPAVVTAIASEPGWQTAAVARLQHQPEMPHPTLPRTLSIQLHPAELGMVTATLRLVGEQLTVELVADGAEARGRLAADSHEITKALRALGFEVDQVSIANQPAAPQPSGRPDDASAQATGSAQMRNETSFGAATSGGNGERLAGRQTDRRQDDGGSTLRGTANLAPDRSRGDLYI